MSVLSAWIVTVLLHSTVLVVLALLASLVLGHRPEAMSGLWKAALFGALVTATVQVGSGASSPWRDASRVMLAAAMPPSLSVVPAATIAISTTAVPAIDVETEHGAASTTATPAIDGDPEDDDASSLAAALPSWIDRVGWLACVGLVLAMVGWLRGAMHLRQQLAGSIVLTQDPLRARLDHLLATSRHRGTVVLAVAPNARVPMATGLLRSTIAVPPAALMLQPEHQDAMLAHELAHLERRDPVWRLAAALVERLFFFQPLLRIATRALAHAAELSCDDWATRATGQPIALARCLTEVAGWSHARPNTRLAIAAAHLASWRRSVLWRRVQRLIDAPSVPVSPRRWLGTCVGTAMLGLVALVPGVAAGKHEPRAPIARSGELHVIERDGAVVVKIDAEREATSSEPTIVVLADDGDPSPRARRRARREHEREARGDRREAKRRLRRAFRQARREHRPGPTPAQLDSIFGTQGNDAEAPREREYVIVLGDDGIELRPRQRAQVRRQLDVRRSEGDAVIRRQHELEREWRHRAKEEARRLHEAEEALREAERRLRALERAYERQESRRSTMPLVPGATQTDLESLLQAAREGERNRQLAERVRQLRREVTPGPAGLAPETPKARLRFVAAP